MNSQEDHQVDINTKEKRYASKTNIKLQNAKQATMLKQCLEIDEELQPNRIHRLIEAKDNILIIQYEAEDAKLLRVAMSSMFDMVTVTIKTLLEFDDSIIQ